jgi:pyruvate,water dikinase
MIIEDYYSNLRGKWTPMDVEWAIDGLTNDLFVQARPETIHSQRNPTTITEYKIEDENRHDKLLLKYCSWR